MSGATGMKLQKEKFISYQEYMKRKQGIKFYNLGVAAQYQNTPNYPEAAKYYQMTLLVNPFDVDAKSALQKIASITAPVTGLTTCQDGLAQAKQCLKKLGICYGR